MSLSAGTHLGLRVAQKVRDKQPVKPTPPAPCGALAWAPGRGSLNLRIHRATAPFPGHLAASHLWPKVPL